MLSLSRLGKKMGDKLSNSSSSNQIDRTVTAGAYKLRRYLPRCVHVACIAISLSRSLGLMECSVFLNCAG